MLSKILLTLTLLSLTTGAFAAEAKKDAKKEEKKSEVKVEVPKKEEPKKEEPKKEEPKKEEPKKEMTFLERFSLNYHGEFGFLRDDNNDFTNYSSLQNPSIGFKILKNLSFNSSLEWRTSDKPNYSVYSANRFYRALFSLSLTNVLTEKEDGLKLDLGIARRYFDRSHPAGLKTYGNNRFNFTMSKSWGDNNGSLFVQYLENDPKTLSGTDASSDNTWRRTIELIPTINLQLTDKLTFTSTDDINYTSAWFSGHNDDNYFSHEWSFAVLTYKFNDILSSYCQFKYTYIPNFSGSDPYELYEYYIGTSYSFTPNFTVTGEIGSWIMSNQDNKTISDNILKPQVYVYIDAAF
jgi:hypothetical protein